MPDSFDPYQQWLEISDPTRPLDHYALLGLNRRESDSKAIAHAADVLMAKLRKIRPGGRLADWGRLLDQIGAAKVCLLDPASKAAYDASLPADPPQQPAPQQATPQAPAGGGVFTSNMAVPPGWAPAPEAAAGQTQPAGPTGMENRTAPDPMAPPGTYPETPAQPNAAPQTPNGPVQTQGWSSAPTPLKMPTPGDLGSGLPPGTQPQAAAQVPAGTPIPPRGSVPQAEAAKPRISTALSAVMLLLAGGLAVYAFWKSRQPEPVPHTSAEQDADDDSPTAADPDTPRDAEPPKSSQQPPEEPPSTPQQPTQPPEQPQPPDTPGNPPPENPPPENPPPNPDPPPPVNPPPQIDPQKQATFAKEASQVRAAMSGRNVEAAQKHLDAARQNAQIPEDTARVARLKLMLDYIDQFWDGMSRSVASLEATQELAVMDTRVAVVESSPQHLIIRAAGRNRQYAIEDIPTVLVMAIVRECFPDEPGAKALIGTFLAVDPDGDRQRARQYWQQAARGGIDVEALMPELDATPGPAAGSGAPKQATPTDRAQVQQAVEAVRATFRRQYAEATTGAKKADLARQIIARARLDTDDATKRFAMLREARDLAIASGDPGVAIEAIDRMAEYFGIDAAGMKGAALEAMSETARGLGGQREIAVAALKLLEQTIQAKRWDEAARLANLAMQAARNSKSTTLIRQAATAKQRIESLRKASTNRP